ncbi:response regulator [Photobacterium kishitanii]|uniref:response regulator n=1 Tax=Photobacterium kishitanii TaxID=318456 RepID=UPI0007F92379|nr:response regulator [Photobacterium kishitanii]OBU32290.1 hybrid sensor histidine kinase/response regulator [Photobacterium kishitanii]PSU23162.1 hybrid sensor histidine kinase/response regulator [Photobacterium kishitanii]PSW50285.1 hybrid sensor histidine kinase/response regulator [Photobacterium kishitanii]
MQNTSETYCISQQLKSQKGLFHKIALMMSGVLICVMLTALTLSYYSNTQRLVKNVKVMMNALAPVFIDTIVFQDTESSLEFNRLISQYKEIRSLSVYDFNNKLLHYYHSDDAQDLNLRPFLYISGLSRYKQDYLLSYPAYFNGDPIFKYVVYYSSSNIIKTIVIQILIYVLPFLFFIVFILFYMYHKVTQPLNYLIRELTKMGSGRLDISGLKKDDSEVSLLAIKLSKVDNYIFDNETKLQGLNNKLQQQTNQLNEALRIKGNFMANMSHEIRTPMNGVLGFVQCLEDKKLDYQSKQQVEYIKQSANALLIIIDEILDYSKLEAGNVELRFNHFHLETFIHGCIAPFEHQLREKNIQLYTDIDANIAPYFDADEGRIRQILTNLLGNAVKFTHRGSIELRVVLLDDIDRTSTAAHDQLGLQQQLCFSVKDSGIGIAPESIDTIFDSYTQADGSISRQFGGTGLGLSISNSLCQLMATTLNVISELGKGTTFWFNVNLKCCDHPQAMSCSENYKNDLSFYADKRILVVEDSKVNQQLIKAFLGSFGLLDINIVSDGVLAIDYIHGHVTDVILMDCQMPNMGGIEATQRIRRMDIVQPYIIALTANVLEQEKQHCLDAGMDDYLSKPIDKKNLSRTLEQAFLQIGTLPLLQKNQQ